jgi:hypothetical protein
MRSRGKIWGVMCDRERDSVEEMGCNRVVFGLGLDVRSRGDSVQWRDAYAIIY